MSHSGDIVNVSSVAELAETTRNSFISHTLATSSESVQALS